MGLPARQCPHDPVCKSSSACSSKRSRLRKKHIADAVLAVAAVSVLAVAVKVGVLLPTRPTRPRDPAAVTAAAAAAAACAASYAHAYAAVTTDKAFTYVTPDLVVWNIVLVPKPKEVVLCLLWFKGLHALVGKQQQKAWNESYCDRYAW